jgi:uncharacterized protein with NAD-binding domain and iron-sulfur cluster
VIIVGGGVAGLTAAHELIERDFDVDVYERRERLGGKAASTRVHPAPPPEGAPRGVQVPREGTPRPGEHGFRFFPAWYRHLPDTLGQIPRRGHREHHRDENVAEHLVPTERNLLAQYNRERLHIILHAPRSSSEAQSALSFARHLATFGLTMSDVVAFFTLLAEFLRTPLDKREQEYDTKSWWSLVQAKERSEAFRTITVATTRALLAAKAEKASAFTIATMAIRTLFDSPNRPDRVLDGPTNEVWIDPWVRYLEGRGVKFHLNHELDEVLFRGDRPKIRGLSFVKSDESLAFRLLREAQTSTHSEKARAVLVAFHETVAAALQRMHESGGSNWAAEVYGVPDYDAALRRNREELARCEGLGLVGLQGVATARLRKLNLSHVTVGTDEDLYIFALPVEQMAYYVDRSTTMKSYDRSLEKLIALSAEVDWMAGIQFYLKSPLKIERGHIVCADSEWALTAIEQTQFWRDVALPARVDSVLSVDVSAWDQPGRFNRKEAFLCTPEEIAEEVWAQLKESLNRSGEQNVLRDSALVTGTVKGSFHLDDDIIERYDRKKQAAYVAGQVRALGRIAALAVPQIEAAPAFGTPFISGERLAMNVEPLLVNRPNSLKLRPDVRTKIENMYLAADYVKTSTNLVSMEGANEAARLAVNAILETVGSRFKPCQTWNFEDRDVLARLASLVSFADQIPGARTSIEAAMGAASSLGALARRATNNAKQLWNKS